MNTTALKIAHACKERAIGSVGEYCKHYWADERLTFDETIHTINMQLRNISVTPMVNEAVLELEELWQSQPVK